MFCVTGVSVAILVSFAASLLLIRNWQSSRNRWKSFLNQSNYPPVTQLETDPVKRNKKLKRSIKIVHFKMYLSI